MDRAIPGRIASAGILLSIALTTGCEMKAYHDCCKRDSGLAENVKLPHGFMPLKGYSVEDAATHFNGWPRYIVSRRDGSVMAYVPSQEIQMGGGTQPDEVPLRHVRVNHFYIDLHEVTNAQFARFAYKVKAADTQCPFAEESLLCRFRDYWTPCVNDAHPVRNVSWREAAHYSWMMRKHLPTEAQWEAAARGSDGRVYPWGNQTESDVTRYLCNSSTGRDNWDGYEYTAPVSSYAAGVSPYGAFNMSGNVREWCGDWYDLGRYAYPSDEDPAGPLVRGALPFGDLYYPNPRAKDIPEARVGPMVGSEKAIRGGAFNDPIERCRVDSRWAAGPDVHMNNVGFRTILPLDPES